MGPNAVGDKLVEGEGIVEIDNAKIITKLPLIKKFVKNGCLNALTKQRIVIVKKEINAKMKKPKVIVQEHMINEKRSVIGILMKLSVSTLPSVMK